MRVQFLFLGLISSLLILSCTKEISMLDTCNSDVDVIESDVLKFSNAVELQNYIDNRIDNSVKTKQTDTFVSLWDYEYNLFMDSLDESVRRQILDEGLIYEPEDELIVDPSFAKVLNPKREIQVGNKIYRYVHEGVIIYDSSLSGDIIDNIDINADNVNSAQELMSGVSFQKIDYRHLVEKEIETRATVPNETTITNQGLVLGGGINIPVSNVRRVIYNQSESDANGFSKWVSGLFGTNVVAIKEFDSKHRIRLRTFSQDYGIYRSVGMAVRFQQKVLGSWFRYKAPEMRFGWTAVECVYRYRDPFRDDLKANMYAIEKSIEGYGKPVILFNVPISNVKNTEITKVVASALNINKTRVTNWVNANPSCKDNPRGIASFDGTNSLRLIYPQMEEIEYDDRREKISWDFNWFSGMMEFSTINASDKYERRSYTLSPIQEITVNRGEFYAAVKYNNTWMACVIYNN